VRVLVESHQYFSAQKTGVGYYQKVLFERLNNLGVEIVHGVFSDTEQNAPVFGGVVRSIVPHTVGVKLHTYGIGIRSEWLWRGLEGINAYIFPDFFAFPSKKPSAVVIHDLAFLTRPEYLPKQRNKIIDYAFPGLATALQRSVPYSIQTADAILVTSASVRDEIVNEYKTRKSSLYINGIPPDAEFFNYKKPVNLNLPTKKYIYFQATIEPRKNHSTLIAAYRMLPKRLRDIYTLVLAGKDGWKHEKALEDIKKAQAEGLCIVRLDYVDEKDKIGLFQHASLYVQPSHYEGFGMPLLEAMASKTPVACSDIAIFREVCADAAEYFDKDSPQSIANAMARILDDNDNIQNMLRKKGSERAIRYASDDSGLTSLLKDFATNSAL